MHRRDAEDGHHLVAAEPLDRAAVLLTTSAIASAYRDMTRRVVSGSVASPSDVEPTTSQKRIVTVFLHLEALLALGRERRAARAAEARAVVRSARRNGHSGHGRV